MKQIIVLVSTIILGLFIAGLILGFQDDAKLLADGGNKGIAQLAEIAEKRGVTDPTAD